MSVPTRLIWRYSARSRHARWRYIRIIIITSMISMAAWCRTTAAITIMPPLKASMGARVMTDFLLYAVIAGIAIAAVAGPLGCFVVWRRMSYFGDTLAHSALLGVALAILMGIHLQLAIILSCALFAGILLALERRQGLAADTLLGIIAHSTLAFGLLILSLSNLVQVNLMAFLFGDLLTIGVTDLWWIVGSCV